MNVIMSNSPTALREIAQSTLEAAVRYEATQVRSKNRNRNSTYSQSRNQSNYGQNLNDYNSRRQRYSNPSYRQKPQRAYQTNNSDRQYTMSVLKKIEDGDMTEQEASNLEKIVNDKVANRQLPNAAKSGEIYNDPYKTRRMYNQFRKEVNEFYKDPDKYQSLKNYHTHIGRTLRTPTHIGLFDDNPHAVARTNAKNTLEANINFYDTVSKLRENTDLSEDEAIELALTHEHVHLGQTEDILSGEPQPYIAEADAERILTEYFTHKAETTKDKTKASRYMRMAEVTAGRYVGILAAWYNGTAYGGAAQQTDQLVKNNFLQLLLTGVGYLPLGTENMNHAKMNAGGINRNEARTLLYHTSNNRGIQELQSVPKDQKIENQRYNVN